MEPRLDVVAAAGKGAQPGLRRRLLRVRRVRPQRRRGAPQPCGGGGGGGRDGG